MSSTTTKSSHETKRNNAACWTSEQYSTMHHKHRSRSTRVALWCFQSVFDIVQLWPTKCLTNVETLPSKKIFRIENDMQNISGSLCTKKERKVINLFIHWILLSIVSFALVIFLFFFKYHASFVNFMFCACVECVRVYLGVPVCVPICVPVSIWSLLFHLSRLPIWVNYRRFLLVQTAFTFN